MKVEDLKLFVKVAELGGFTKAANALDLPRANVSRRINELERTLNHRLFHRTTRNISLTHNGEAYYEKLLKVLESLDAANQTLSNTQKTIKGRVKLGVLPETSEQLLPILFDFNDKYPDVELDIRIINNGFSEMFEYGLDIAFHSGTLFDSDIIARKLLSLNRCLVASTEYIKQYGKPERLEDLKNHPCICIRWPSGDIDNVWQFNEASVTIIPKMIANSIGFIRGACLYGRGISFLPKLMIQSELDAGLMEIILPEYTATEEFGWLLYPQPQTLNEASRKLIEHLMIEVPKLA
ncbi:MAG: LysR family transcriptional regulator [Psychromonas sp.]